MGIAQNEHLLNALLSVRLLTEYKTKKEKGECFHDVFNHNKSSCIYLKKKRILKGFVPSRFQLLR